MMQVAHDRHVSDQLWSLYQARQSCCAILGGFVILHHAPHLLILNGCNDGHLQGLSVSIHNQCFNISAVYFFSSGAVLVTLMQYNSCTWIFLVHVHIIILIHSGPTYSVHIIIGRVIISSAVIRLVAFLIIGYIWTYVVSKFLL